MAKKSSRRDLNSVPAIVASAFGAVPLFEGEDAKGYATLRKQIRDGLNPTDVIDEMWVQDCTDLYWETLRLRRLKVQLIDANLRKGLKPVLETIYSGVEVLRMMMKLPERGLVEHINGLLKGRKMSIEDGQGTNHGRDHRQNRAHQPDDYGFRSEAPCGFAGT